MTVRNVNPKGLAWPDYWFLPTDGKKSTWEEQLSVFRSEISALSESLFERLRKKDRGTETEDNKRRAP